MKQVFSYLCTTIGEKIMSKKIVLTGGGTAGHCYPNLALVPTLNSMGYEIAYIGSLSGIKKVLQRQKALSILVSPQVN